MSSAAYSLMDTKPDMRSLFGAIRTRLLDGNQIPKEIVL